MFIIKGSDSGFRKRGKYFELPFWVLFPVYIVRRAVEPIGRV